MSYRSVPHTLPGYLDYFSLVAPPLSVVVVGGVGVLMEQGILRFLYGGRWKPPHYLGHWHDSTARRPALFWRPDERQPAYLVSGRLGDHARTHFSLYMFIIALSLFCLAVVYWLLYRSDVGLRVRSVMQNRDMASCMGISARTVDTLTFAMGTALAGLAGCALSLIGTVDPEVGRPILLILFSSSCWEASANCLAPYWPHSVLACPTNSSNRPLGDCRGCLCQGGHFSLVIVFLQLKPTGLFPAKERTARHAALVLRTARCCAQLTAPLV